MSVIIGEVETFPDVKADKAQAVRVLEESAEVFGAWQAWERMEDEELKPWIVEESADIIQAVCNLLDALGVEDMRDAIAECKRRNHDRGRI